VVFHLPCTDGMAAQYAFFMAYKRSGVSVDHIEFWGMDPAAAPNVTDEFRDKSVIFVDLCPQSRDKDGNVLDALHYIKKWGITAYLVIDHHPAAKEQIELLGERNVIFDEKECGATLAMRYLYRDAVIPDVIRAIHAHDINQTDLFPEHEAVYRGLEVLMLADPRCPGCFHKAVVDIGVVLNDVTRELERKRQSELDTTARRAVMCHRGGHRLWVVESDNYALVNDLCRRILSLAPDRERDTAATHYYDEALGHTKWSFRSNPGATTVARWFAQSFGGDGHTHAGGASTPGRDVAVLFDTPGA
jgi:hypothetical protein